LRCDQAADAEQLDDRVEVASRAAGPARKPAAVEQVLAHAEMREQAAILEDVADAAAVLRHEHAAFGIDQRLAVDHDLAALAAGSGRRRCRPGSTFPIPSGRTGRSRRVAW
jgi:hypothetical protein